MSYQQQQQVDRFMDAIMARVDAKIAAAMSARTGVAEGGPYNQFAVDKSGRISWADLSAGPAQLAWAQIKYTGGQSVSSGSTPTQIGFSSLVVDTGSFATAGGFYAYDGFTVPTGQYLLLWAAGVDGLGSGYVDVQVVVGGSTIRAWVRDDPGSYEKHWTASALISVFGTTNITMTQAQTSGSSGGLFDIFFSIVQISTNGA